MPSSVRKLFVSNLRAALRFRLVIPKKIKLA
jgi:hypothetical protein